MSTLLVIVPDKISAILAKGEYPPRYYNPGNFFDQVHILMTNDDRPDPKSVQKLVGSAKVYLHRLPQPSHFFVRTLGWSPPLMELWINEGIQLAGEIKPDLVRTHGHFVEGFLAYSMKIKLGIPYVSSIHALWDVAEFTNWNEKIRLLLAKRIQRKTLKNADAVICVYSTILDYVKRFEATRPLLVYNFVSNAHIQPVIHRDLSCPVHLVTVNNQIPGKDPTNIVKAIAKCSFDVKYTLVGTGILHNGLKQLTRRLNLEKKVDFVPSLPNEDVCRLYHDADLVVSNCHYKGISKTIIEAALTGLPIVINRYKDGYKLAEYEGDWLEQCDDTPEGYAGAIEKLVIDNVYRQSLGQKAFQHAWKHFDPDRLEKKVVDIYRSILELQ
jgi:glycosyltransferase involved in cell wall biosynthesis